MGRRRTWWRAYMAGNLMEGYTYGLEVAVDYFPLDGWRLQGAYTYLKMHLKRKEGQSRHNRCAI